MNMTERELRLSTLNAEGGRKADRIPLTIEALREAELRTKEKATIGGAPVSQELATQIGADGYAPDGASAVDVISTLLSDE
ncbi:MAG: hypothetical protein CL726_02330 [Chloroflexi bacterium]|nr:hypothetical protein [Chloroflexota bacterium]|tara:strand:+ start:18458 stop:18700 length:243 start_codon:yes stop_codon:yes gene_type:complete